MTGSSKTCTKCKETLSLSAFHRNKKSKTNCQPRCKSCCSRDHKERYSKNKEQVLERQATYYQANKTKKKEWHRKHRANKKEQVYDNYGTACKCCGETDAAFLTIDHINNDGAEHRRSINAASIYDYIIKHNFPDTFQVLCFNCNWAKSRGGCPHQNTSKLAATQS